MKAWFMAVVCGAAVFAGGCAGYETVTDRLTGMETEAWNQDVGKTRGEKETDPDQRDLEREWQEPGAEAQKEEKQAGGDAASAGGTGTKDLDHQLATAAVCFLDSEEMLLYGEKAPAQHPLLVRDGLLYVPVNGLAEYAGASLAEYDQMLYISSQGMLSVISEPYNIALTGTTAEFLEGGVFCQGDCYYVPAEDLEKLLHVPVYSDSLQGTVIVKGLGTFEEKDIRLIRRNMGLEEITWEAPRELKLLCDRQGIEPEQCLEAFHEGRVYRTDSNGKIGSWELLCDGTLRWKAIELSCRYEPDRIYMAGKESERRQLYLAGGTKEAAGMIPELKAEEELRQQARERIEEKTAKDLGREGENLFRKVSREESTGMWKQLEKAAEPGDILLFYNPLSAARYGYFNHSALVLGKTEKGIHLLQARGSEEGVGSDKETDWLNEEKLKEQGYWKGNEVIVLCGVEGIRKEQAENVAREAPGFYEGYQFGYGSFRGLRETNCAELIAGSYKRAGISLVEEEGSRLRQLLEGRAQSLVVLPDDLALSNRVKAKACWLAGEEEQS